MVKAGNHLFWDLVFLGSEMVLILIGGIPIRAGRHDQILRYDR